MSDEEELKQLVLEWKAEVEEFRRQTTPKQVGNKVVRPTNVSPVTLTRLDKLIDKLNLVKWSVPEQPVIINIQAVPGRDPSEIEAILKAK